MKLRQMVLNWRKDCESLKDSQLAAAEFQDELDQHVWPYLWCLFKMEVITPEEFVQFGGWCQEQWAEVYLAEKSV